MLLANAAASTASSQGGAAGDAGQQIGDWYKGINPEARSALLRGLGGAAVGGITAGGMSALTPRDEDAPSPVLRNALMGALMGGGAAAALPAGLKMLGGKTRFSGEPKPGIMGTGFNMLAKPFEKAPLTATGAAIGGAATLSQLGPIRKALALARDSQAQRPNPFRAGPARPFIDPWVMPLGSIKNQLLNMKGAIGDRLRNVGASALRTRPGQAARAYRGAFGQMDAAVDSLHAARQSAAKASKNSVRSLAKQGWRGKMGLAAIPAGILLGALADSYAKGRVN